MVREGGGCGQWGEGKDEATVVMVVTVREGGGGGGRRKRKRKRKGICVLLKVRREKMERESHK